MIEEDAIIDDTYHARIKSVEELAFFLEKVVAVIPYHYQTKWGFTTNEFISNGGLCTQFAKFLNNVLSGNKEFNSRIATGKAFNKVIDDINYLYTNQFFDEPLAHMWIKFDYKNESYTCDPSIWSLQLHNNLSLIHI